MASDWLLYSAGDLRQHAGNDGYDDEPDSVYEWDSSVPHASDVAVGDRVVVWNSVVGALGVSVVEEIEHALGVKQLNKCPLCGTSQIKRRRRRTPAFRCSECKGEFAAPVVTSKRVTMFWGRHDAAWLDLEGLIPPAVVRSFGRPGDQLSIRPFVWERLREYLEGVGIAAPLARVEGRATGLIGGHVSALVRVRKGQGAFRKDLLTKFGSTCAFSGVQPVEVLEAAHLYSYAKLGAHLEHGGLLLRSDLHALFDRGLLLVDASARLHVAAPLLEHPLYSALDGRAIQVPLMNKHREWLALHWNEHAAGAP